MGTVMKEKSYYSITTRRFTLRCGHPQWLQTTQDFYNRIVLFYYDLYLDLWDSGSREGLSGQQALRRLEQLSIVGRDKKPVLYPLPWEHVPLYFRRSAANKGIAAARSYIARNPKPNEEMQKLQGSQAARSRCFQEPVTFYKGMYKELTDKSVELKVFNGLKWRYLHCRLSANTIPEGGICHSPSVFLRGKEMYLNVPVYCPVTDGRKTKERMQQGSNLCAIQFAASDIFAVCQITDCEGTELDTLFIHGAREYAHRCRQELCKINKSEKARRLLDDRQEIIEQGNADYFENHKYWMKLKHLSDYFSNSVSRQVINYCMKNNVGIIVLPEYDKQYTKYVMCKSGNWSGIHLSTKIREQLFYKAWQNGILVLETAPYDCGRICAVCGAGLHRSKTDYICDNGHRGSKYLNSARNLNKLFRKSIASQKHL